MHRVIYYDINEKRQKDVKRAWFQTRHFPYLDIQLSSCIYHLVDEMFHVKQQNRILVMGSSLESNYLSYKLNENCSQFNNCSVVFLYDYISQKMALESHQLICEKRPQETEEWLGFFDKYSYVFEKPQQPMLQGA